MVHRALQEITVGQPQNQMVRPYRDFQAWNLVGRDRPPTFDGLGTKLHVVMPCAISNFGIPVIHIVVGP